ncbi:conserved hypothetical protein [Desulfamplus magnetovallimortis]|uniref:Ribosomal RNA small subunit methyltransferase E n=1 Tax=Desulfamplus magnetovallimortis TaxID=1246637 RepID=A0A1W1HBS5_9BACT|nr:RsmE family RNA methyltransferase [Desulfamplus magnetovallimortis]SLM29893.1 conserved hypothetical protein [Desulfamplus magnetovallimortis]
MHRFYIDKNNIKGTHAIITGQDSRHLASVMRLGSGDMVELADGNGCHYLARVESTSAGQTDLTILKTSHLKAESMAYIAIAQGVLKDKKMDTLLRQLTELGIMEWMPFFAKRSVPVPAPKKDGARVERWQKIAQEAMKQCGRSVLPKINPPSSFDDIMTISRQYDKKILFWERSESPLDLLRKKEESSETRSLKILIMTGPEGGFSEDEAKTATENGFISLSMGPRILRAETATVTACALVQNIFGDLGKKE